MKGIIIALASWVFTVVVLTGIFKDISETIIVAVLNIACFVGVFLELEEMKRKIDKR